MSSPLLSHTGQDSTVSYHDSPSNIKRKLFQKTRPKCCYNNDVLIILHYNYDHTANKYHFFKFQAV